ncbi:heme-binding protein [Methanolobus sp.]|jgi:hypothetical protein|uniref:SOUL family heme-binding protein n=1 Tax=Methanolobus sp. TaxID=1874737 RepID=UPI0025EC766F|nr:heme-binding protein [Methanolobus sp.]
MDKAGVIFALLTVLAVMVVSWFFAGVHVLMVTEQFEYKVLYELDNNVEVRQYGEMTVISTSLKDSGAVFSSLASYISGKNGENLKISMTSPVITSDQGTTLNMSFILPSGYDVNNAPEPDAPNISIKTVPARKLAAIRFSGYVNDKVVEQQRYILSSQLNVNGVATKGEFFLMRYNPPWVPPALKRNEVAIEVD